MLLASLFSTNNRLSEPGRGALPKKEFVGGSPLSAASWPQRHRCMALTWHAAELECRVEEAAVDESSGWVRGPYRSARRQGEPVRGLLAPIMLGEGVLNSFDLR